MVDKVLITQEIEKMEEVVNKISFLDEIKNIEEDIIKYKLSKSIVSTPVKGLIKSKIVTSNYKSNYSNNSNKKINVKGYSPTSYENSKNDVTIVNKNFKNSKTTVNVVNETPSKFKLKDLKELKKNKFQ